MRGAATPTGRVDGYQVFAVEPGDVTFQQGTTHRRRRRRHGAGDALAYASGTPATFGAFTPGVAKEYTASTTANVISTAGDAALTVCDAGSPDQRRRSRCPQPLQVSFSKSAWTAPVSNDPVDDRVQAARSKANDPLRTGSYARTLTFTLSTTTP